MGRNISHGSNQNGEERLSCLSIDQLGEQLAHVLPGHDWAKIRHLFAGKQDIVKVASAAAQGYAAILRAAATSQRMPANWAGEAHLVADAADRAAQAGEPWMWS